MHDPTYRPEHSWIPDALAFTRYTVNRADDRGFTTLYDMEALVSVVQRLARELEVTRPGPVEDAVQTPPDVETAILEETGWQRMSYGDYQRLTVDGTHLWTLAPQTSNRSDGWWALKLYRRYLGEKAPGQYTNVGIEAQDVHAAARESNEFIRLFHTVPLDSPWELRSHQPVRLTRYGGGPDDPSWEIENKSYGFILTCPLEGPETWTILEDEIPGILTEADGIIERREITKRRMQKIVPPPPSGPRIAGEGD